MKMKLGGKVLLIAIAVIGVGYGANKLMDKGYFNEKPTVASAIPEKFDLPVAGTENVVTSKTSVAPASNKCNIKVLTIPWNGTMGLQYANGDVTTASNSLMAKHGVNVTLERQDMYDQMIAELASFGKQVHEGNSCPSEGAAFVIIMGDAYPNFAVGATKALSRYNQVPEAIAQIGFSRGEDKCMLPVEVKSNPQLARGKTIAGVKMDGDLHICFKWASDNGIPVNPNDKTYDADALNFVYVDSFTAADEKLIAGYCEQRTVVSNGKKTGDEKNVCVDGTATWTPGDVKIAKKKGGIASIASTKEYSYQMPTLLIGNKQWMAANSNLVENFLAATFEGSEIVKNNDTALMKAAATSAKVYKEENAEYWAKYFKGVTERDAKGLQISLGGSTTSNLADNAFYFGLNGNSNVFKRVYTVYGQMDNKYYPQDLPVILPYENVVNTAYLQSLLSKTQVMASADVPTYSTKSAVTEVVAKKAYHIEFTTGKADFTPEASATLEDLLNQLSATNLTVQVSGHTDNVGNQQSNLILSKKRADAVKAWIIANAPSEFPTERIRTRGYGDTQPVASNTSDAGKSKNRRVDISLVATE